jgi:hypothetical protein
MKTKQKEKSMAKNKKPATLGALLRKRLKVKPTLGQLLRARLGLPVTL